MLKTVLAPTLIIMMTALSHAQPRITITGPPVVSPGQTVALTLNVDQTAGLNVAAAQWTLPAGVTWDQSLSPSGKAIVPSGNIFLLFGATPQPVNGIAAPGTVYNRTVLIDGPLQGLSYTVPANAVAGSTINIAAVSPFGISDLGAVITFSSVPFALQVASTLDLNSDGRVDNADAQIALTRWISTHSSADLVLLVKLIALL